MSKIAIIDYCGDCPHRYYKGNDLYCELEEKETHENNPIPDWCPLPDKEVTGWDDSMTLKLRSAMQGTP